MCFCRYTLAAKCMSHISHTSLESILSLKWIQMKTFRSFNGRIVNYRKIYRDAYCPLQDWLCIWRAVIFPNRSSQFLHLNGRTVICPAMWARQLCLLWKNFGQCLHNMFTNSFGLSGSLCLTECKANWPCVLYDLPQILQMISFCAWVVLCAMISSFVSNDFMQMKQVPNGLRPQSDRKCSNNRLLIIILVPETKFKHISVDCIETNCNW